MANEEKDGLFSQNLGDGLIDIPEKTEEPAASTTAEETTETKTETTEKTEEAGFTQHEDGTIEIDESLQKAIDTRDSKDTADHLSPMFK